MAAIPFVSLEEDIQDNDLDDFVEGHQAELQSSDGTPNPIVSTSSAFSFSHVPLATVTGSRRWPGVHDSQSQSSNANLAPTIVDVWVHVLQYLARSDQSNLCQVALVFSLGILCGPLWLTRPWQPN